MAKQTINIGTTANDGTGDPIRAAFGKVNDNFTEIYTANTGVNTGDQNLSAYATTAAVAAGYQPLDSDLTAISALTTTAYGRALLSTADAATLRSAIGVGTTDAPTFAGISVPAIIGTNGGNSLQFSFVGARSVMLGNGELRVSGNSVIGWSGNGTHADAFGATVILARDADGILAQRNGVAKQAFRVYNTALSGAPEWAEFDWITSGGTNTLRIGTNLSGTGAARPIDFVVGGVVKLSIASNGLTGPNDVFSGPTVSMPGYLRIAGAVMSAGSSGNCSFLIEHAASRKAISGSASLIAWSNITAGNETSLLSGIDIALGRNAPGVLEVNTGTAGTYGFLKAKLQTSTAYTGTVVTPTGYITIYDSTGQAYRVPCVV